MYAMMIPEESTTKNPCVELSFAPVESVEAMGGGETRYLVAERGRTSQNNSLSVLFNTSLSVFFVDILHHLISKKIKRVVNNPPPSRRRKVAPRPALPRYHCIDRCDRQDLALRPHSYRQPPALHLVVPRLSPLQAGYPQSPFAF